MKNLLAAIEREYVLLKIQLTTRVVRYYKLISWSLYDKYR